MPRKASLVILAAAAALAAAGCGGDESSDTGAEVSEDGKVLIANFRYDPETITVEPGQPVTFVNSDVAPHTATADDEKSFDTGRLEIEDEGELTFDEPGTYGYFCDFHPFMRGTVEVVE
jgi:plastocyanin